MKKVIAILLAILLIFTSTTAYAQDRTSVLKTGGFAQLSDEDMNDTVTALVAKISKDAGLPYTPIVSCFDWPENYTLAYNTLITKTICVNLSHFRNSVSADAEGVSIEYLLVKSLAHEVRHSYQYEHQYDDSDYGRACYAHINNYQEFNGDLSAYNAQFGEADAEAWGISYADEYFKPKKKKSK